MLRSGVVNRLKFELKRFPATLTTRMTALPLFSVPVIGFIAPSGSGKTTLLRQVISLLSAQGRRVGVLKQARDDFDVDIPGKDSYELRKAGIERLLLASAEQLALIDEHPDGDDPQLCEALTLFMPDSLDLILVEGFASAAYPKIEIYRQGNATPRYPTDPHIIAIATDWDALSTTLPLLNLNDPPAVAAFILAWSHHHEH